LAIDASPSAEEALETNERPDPSPGPSAPFCDGDAIAASYGGVTQCSSVPPTCLPACLPGAGTLPGLPARFAVARPRGRAPCPEDRQGKGRAHAGEERSGEGADWEEDHFPVVIAAHHLKRFM